MPSFNTIGSGPVGKLIGYVISLVKKRRFRRGIAGVIFFLLLSFLISANFVPDQVNLQIGQVSRENVFSPRTVVYEDRDKTEEHRQQAMESVGKQYNRFEEVETAVLNDINAVIQSLKVVQQEQGIEDADRMKKTAEVIPLTLPEQTLRVLSQPDNESLSVLTGEIYDIVSAAMHQDTGITDENIDDAVVEINKKIAELKLSDEYIQLGQGLVKLYLRPNTFYDEEKTRTMQLAARDSVPPVMVTIRNGEKIIGAGEIVNAQHLQKLEAVGLASGGIPWTAFWGTAFLVALLMLVVLVYLYQQCREIYENAGVLYLLGIIVLAVLVICKAILTINLSKSPELGALMGYMAPVGTAGMLIAILLDSRLAVLVVSLMSFILAIMAGGQVNFGIVGLIGGITGIYSVSRLSQRGDLARAGFYTSAASIAAIAVMGMVSDLDPLLILKSALIFGTANGLLSSILTNGSLPYLENAFGITSSVRLLELSHASNPLLKKLLTESPGTYHHSIMVANLAESAAEAVGGDSLLVRVGSYFHDIGKIKRPYFFIENQMSNNNPHDKIAPSLSTLILTSHVRDGVDLAREYQLPQTIINMIEQHHGTGLVTYFYHKARENGTNVNEDEFRYEGPKPKTKEAAIVMLADSVEAAVRSMQNPSHSRIEGLVRKILRERMLDGQLDECNLTFRDLEKIAEAFMKILSGIYHSRIEYPDMTKEIERRKSKHGGYNKRYAKGSAN